MGSNPIGRLTEVLNPPLEEMYRVSYILARSDDTGTRFERVKNRQMPRADLLDFLNQPHLTPVLVCQVEDRHDPGSFAFIDEARDVFRNARESVAFRKCGRFFLRQLIEDATHNAVDGSGRFEVHPLPANPGDDSDLINGAISRYFTRGNTIFKQLAGRDLHSIGLRRHGRRDSYVDENGNTLPTYAYQLTCSLVLIRHPE